MQVLQRGQEEGSVSLAFRMQTESVQETSNCPTADSFGSAGQYHSRSSCQCYPFGKLDKRSMSNFIFIPVRINGHTLSAFIDTGADVHLMSDSTASQLNLTPHPPTLQINELTGISESIGRVSVNIQIAHVTKSITIHIIKSFRYPLLLGIHLGDNFDINCSLKNRNASIRTSSTNIAQLRSKSAPHVVHHATSKSHLKCPKKIEEGSLTLGSKGSPLDSMLNFKINRSKDGPPSKRRTFSRTLASHHSFHTNNMGDSQNESKESQGIPLCHNTTSSILDHFDHLGPVLNEAPPQEVFNCFEPINNQELSLPIITEGSTSTPENRPIIIVNESQVSMKESNKSIQTNMSRGTQPDSGVVNTKEITNPRPDSNLIHKSSPTDPKMGNTIDSCIRHTCPLPDDRDPQEEISPLIEMYSNLFSEGDSDIGCIDFVKHHIRTPNNHPPIAKRPYRKSPHVQDKIRRHFQELKEKGIVRDSSSPWAFPVVGVPKGDGGERYCGDYRELNAVTIDDKFPLPRVEDCIDRMKGAKFITKLDVRWGYWHVKMNPADIEKTAVITQDGHFEWLVMPFGLKTAPATFQRIMQQVLGPLLFTTCIVYLDDVIIMSETLDQHTRDVEEVFIRLAVHNIRLKRSKCLFAQQYVEFLGSVIGNDEVRPGTRKVTAVNDYLQPRSIKDVQRFLGLTNWFRRFIQNYAEVTYPLTQLLRKPSEFKFEEPQIKAFNQLKDILTKEPILKIFDPNSTCELFTDASKIGIGAILCQRDSDQNLRVIAYYSKRLSPSQEKWHATDLESFALVDSVKHFDHYLRGHPFIAYTDHSALQWLLRSDDLDGKQWRWFLRLSTYNMQIIHRPGTQMAHVDALSRAPGTALIFHVTPSFNSITMEQIKAAQKSSDLSFLANPILHNDIIYVRRNEALRAVVPQPLRKSIVEYYHEKFHHPGINKTRRLVGHYYWWPNLVDDVTDFVHKCSRCQLSKPSNSPSFGQLQLMPTPNQPLELVSMDTMIMGTAAKDSAAKNLQVIIDHHSRYVWAVPTPKNTFLSVRNVLQNVFSSTPWPKKILTDRGTNFTTKQFRDFLSTHDCKRILTTSYHPQTNGIVEKMNRTLKEKLVIATQNNPRRKWSSLVSDVVKSYNDTPHDVTGFPPIYLMFGLPPSDSPLPPPQMPPIETARKLAIERTLKHQEVRKVRYDETHKNIVFSPGDEVKRLIPSNHPSLHKLSPKFEGPFIVESQSGQNTYWIRSPHDGLQPFHTNVSLLCSWYSSEDSFSKEGESEPSGSMSSSSPSTSASDPSDTNSSILRD